MLPITKSTPKEMLAIGRKPVIQFAVEEIVASGIREIVLVTAPGKTTIEEYFQRDPRLEGFLNERGHDSLASLVSALSQLADIRVVHQEQPLGLGHAVSCARRELNSEAFALVLPDAFIISTYPCLRQLLDCYQSMPGAYVASREVEPEEFSRFGILKIAENINPIASPRRLRVHGLVEKPPPDVAPSRFGVFGRYLFEDAIFEYIEKENHGTRREIEITDAMSRYCSDLPMYAVCFEGEHYDVGNELGLLEASVSIGLRSPEMGEEFRRFLTSTLQSS